MYAIYISGLHGYAIYIYLGSMGDREHSQLQNRPRTCTLNSREKTSVIPEANLGEDNLTERTSNLYSVLHPKGLALGLCRDTGLF